MLAADDWDYIVVQDYSTLLTVKRAREIYNQPALSEFIGAKKTAKLVLYSTWGYINGTAPCPGDGTAECFPLGTLNTLTSPLCTSSPDYGSKVGSFDCMTYSVSRGYLEAFRQSGVDVIVPCGMAWQVARGSTSVPAACRAAVDKEYSAPMELTLPLAVGAHEDTSGITMYLKLSNGAWDKHPSMAGQYLNALTFYSVLFNASPLGAAAPATIGISKTQVTGLQQVAAMVGQTYRAHWVKQ